MDENQINEILSAFPGLKLKEKGKFIGFIDIGDMDQYEIEADFSRFPIQFPSVRETGERIPKKADRHVYQDTGNFCFTTSAREQILLKKSIKTLPDFFNRILIPFLLNNSYYELNGTYIHGEYPHGVPGIIAGYSDILGIADTRRFISIIRDRLKGIKIRPNDLCFCGSKLKIKKCSTHYERYKEFRLIDKICLQRDYEMIIEYLS